MPRKPKIPHSPFNGATLDLWQQSPPWVDWAKSDPMFGNVLAVIQNGLLSVPPEDLNGFRKAVHMLIALRQHAPTIKPMPPADYREPADGLEGLDEAAED